MSCRSDELSKWRLWRCLVLSTGCLVVASIAAPAGAQPAPDPAPDSPDATTPDAPTREQTAAATAAWKLCRELEQRGPAGGCWALWLEQHRAHGSEAEVLVAEERVKAAKAPPPEEEAPPTEGRPVAEPRVDAENVDTEKEAGGEGTSSPSPEPTGVAPTPSIPRGTVLDFCKLKPRKDAKRFVKQRVLIFDVAGVGQLASDPAFRQRNAAKLFRHEFLARLPLRRFHNVVTTIPAQRGWARRRRLPAREVVTSLLKQTVEEAAFFARSAGCADYLVIPRLRTAEVTWQEQEVQVRRGEQTVKMKVRAPQLAATVRLAVFHRVGTVFRRLGILRRSVPSFVDLATDRAAGAVLEAADRAQQALPVDMKTLQAVQQLPGHISALPEPRCLASLAGRGLRGLGKCGGEGPAPVLALGRIDARLSESCKAQRKAKSPEDYVDSGIRCESIVRAAQAARSLQRAAKELKGWKLFAPLQGSEKRGYGVSLGKEEGVAVGYGFIGKRSGAYLRVHEVGPGGVEGMKEPTGLVRRIGVPKRGERLDEVPFLGIDLGAYLATSYVTHAWGPSYAVARDDSLVLYRLPEVVGGGGGQLAWNLDGATGFTDLALRVGFGYQHGWGENTELGLVPTDVVVEKGGVVDGRLSLFAAAGWSMTYALLNVHETDAGTPAESLATFSHGPTARAGMDILISPRWSWRVLGVGRLNIARGDWGEDASETFRRREDYLSNVGVAMSLRCML